MDDSVNPSELVDSKEAIRLLGIKLPTLYAYVSRGLLRSVGGASARKRLYLRSDVERLQARNSARAGLTAIAGGAMRWGAPVLDSAITAISDRGPLYRGIAAVDLAEAGASFESVAELLWTGTRKDLWWPVATPGFDPAQLRQLLPRGAGTVPSLMLVTDLLALGDPTRHGATADAELSRGRTLIRRLAAALALSADARRTRVALRQPSVAQSVAVALGAGKSRGAVDAINRSLVLSADHELNASTFAARIAASAGSDLYGSVSAALATASGFRHGGSSDRVEALLREVTTPGQAAKVISDRFRRGEQVPGFGHTLYPRGDPRSAPLLEAARELAPRSLAVKTAFALIEVMRDAGHPAPAVDYALVVVALALGLPAGSAAALFSLGRTAGWIAHVLEQREQGFLLRPRARYVGPPAPGAASTR